MIPILKTHDATKAIGKVTVTEAGLEVLFVSGEEVTKDVFESTFGYFGYTVLEWTVVEDVSKVKRALIRCWSIEG